jgi:hypothetical protein
VITVTVLNSVHHSPLLAVCAALTGTAAYLQATYVSPASVLHLYCTFVVVMSYPEGWLLYCVPCLFTAKMDAKLSLEEEGDVESSDEEN